MPDGRDRLIIDAEAGELDLRSLCRVAAWGTGAAAALLLAVLAALSGPGHQHAMTALGRLTGNAGLTAPPDPALQRDRRIARTETATRRLPDAVRELRAERDGLAQRLTAIEHDLADVTGLIKRAEAAAAEQRARPAPLAAKPSASAAWQPRPVTAPAPAVATPNAAWLHAAAVWAAAAPPPGGPETASKLCSEILKTGRSCEPASFDSQRLR